MRLDRDAYCTCTVAVSDMPGRQRQRLQQHQQQTSTYTVQTKNSHYPPTMNAHTRVHLTHCSSEKLGSHSQRHKKGAAAAQEPLQTMRPSVCPRTKQRRQKQHKPGLAASRPCLGIFDGHSSLGWAGRPAMMPRHAPSNKSTQHYKYACSLFSTGGVVSYSG